MKINFVNENREVEAELGDSILDVAEKHDIDLDHACGGNCSCSTCHIYIEAGMECLSAMEEDEDALLETADSRDDSSRLSCQARIVREGDITARIPD